MIEWVRVSCGIVRDPKTLALADALQVRAAEAVGLLTCLFAQMAEHAQDGRIGHLPARTIEAWAEWEGERGALAPVLLRLLCDESGLVTGWAKHNGSAIERAVADADRKRSKRAEAREHKDAAEDVPRTSRGQSAGHPTDAPQAIQRDVTRRDVREDQLPDDDARVSVPLTHPAAIEAYRAMRERVMSPALFDAMLRTVAEPMTGGTAYGWDEIGQALVELAPQGGATAAAIRAFCRRVRAGDPVRGTAPEDGLAELRRIRVEADAAVAREQAQGVANG